MTCNDYGQSVFNEIRSLLSALDAPARQASIYDRILAGVEECASRSGLFLPIDVPVSICEIYDLDDEILLTSASACTLLWAGADLMDDVADGDCSTNWDVSEQQLALLYTNLLATLPHLILNSCSGRSEASAWSEFSASVAHALWRMSQGQFRDLESARAVNSTSDYLTMLGEKTGAEIRLFASAPVILGDMTATIKDAWREFGMQFGCMAQLFTDIRGTFESSSRNELLKGKRTLPVIYTLESLTGDRRNEFKRDLELAAAGASDAVERAIDQMHECEAVHYSLSKVELLRHRAASALLINLGDLELHHPFRSLVKSYSVQW